MISEANLELQSFASWPRPIIIILYVLCAFWIGLAALATYYSFPGGGYDEGVYYYSALKLANGNVPYRDYFLAHPPGLSCLVAALVRCGLGLSELRWAQLLISLGIPLITAEWLRHFIGPVRGLRPLTILFVLSAPSYFSSLNSILTHQPAMALMMGGVACYSVPDKRGLRLFASIVLLIGAVMFRLQSIYILPGLIAMHSVSSGWRSGLRRGLILALGVAAGVAIASMLIDIYVGRYFEDIIQFHIRRVPTGIAWRVEQIQETLSRPEYLLGLICALLQLASPNPQVRSIAVLALVTTGLTIYSSRSFYPHYFLFVLPFCSACLANQVLSRFGQCARWWPSFLVVLFLTALQTQNVVEQLRRFIKTQRETSVHQIRPLGDMEKLRDDSTIRTILADPLVAIEAGKLLPDSYYSTDPYAASALGVYDEWIAEVYPYVDAIVMTGAFLSRLGDRGVATIRDGPKPIYFPDNNTKLLWEMKTKAP
jgi:hypothetical protein